MVKHVSKKTRMKAARAFNKVYGSTAWKNGKPKFKSGLYRLADAYDLNNGSNMNIQATSDQMFAEVIFKYIGKVGISNIKEFSFLFNSNPINPSTFKSLNDLGINNGAIIRVVKGDAGQIKYMNICFSIIGRNVIVQGQSNMKFSELVAKFSIKADIKPEDKATFILNSQQVNGEDSRTLSDLNLHDQSRIEVVLIKDVIGAK